MQDLRLVLTFVDIALLPIVLAVFLLRISKRLGRIGTDLGETFATAWQVVVDVSLVLPQELGQVNATLETIAGAAPILIGLAQDLGDALEAKQAGRVPAAVAAAPAPAPAGQGAPPRSPSKTPRRRSYLGGTTGAVGTPVRAAAPPAQAGKTPWRHSYLGA